MAIPTSYTLRHYPEHPTSSFALAKKVIFVHGCFWHLHSKCSEGRMPATRRDYWVPKLTRNVERDRQHTRALQKMGWRLLTIWECDLKSQDKLARKLNRFLS